MNAFKEEIKNLGHFSVQPMVDGVYIEYDSRAETFIYNKKTFKKRLGRATYKPILGCLTLSQIDFEKINYRRAQNHMPLFKTVAEAVVFILEEKKQAHLDALQFIAYCLADSTKKENELLRKLHYDVPDIYVSQDLDSAYSYLEKLSHCQTPQQYADFFNLSAPTYISHIFLRNASARTYFLNQNLAQVPSIIEREDFADEEGVIRSRFLIEDMTILDKLFTSHTKLYGDITKLTLRNNRLYDLSPQSTYALQNCPSCNVLLESNCCTNYYCKEKVIERAYYLASNNGMGIKGLSKKTLRLIYDYLIQTKNVAPYHMNDVFYLLMTSEDVAKLGFESLQTKLLSASLEKAKEKQSLTAIINGLRIPGCNKQASKALSNTCSQNMTLLINAFDTELKNIPGLDKKVETLRIIRRLVKHFTQ